LTGELITQLPAESVTLRVVPRDTRSELVENLLDISREFAFLVELFSKVVNLALLICDEGSEFSSHYPFVTASPIFDGIHILLDELHCGTEVRDFEAGGLLESRNRGGKHINNVRDS
jgi:hypothetical protein